MLAETVELHDVQDVEGFVQATLNASKRFYAPAEREDLVAEGLALMCRLANDFDGRGRFSGFAAKYLRLKLEDAYHRLHPEHMLRTQEDGSRRYKYGPGAVSLQALTADDGEDREELLSAREEDAQPASTIASMLHEQLERQYDNCMRVAGLLAEGVTSDREIADVIGLTTEMVREAREKLEPIAQRLRTLNQR